MPTDPPLSGFTIRAPKPPALSAALEESLHRVLVTEVEGREDAGVAQPTVTEVASSVDSNLGTDRLSDQRHVAGEHDDLPYAGSVQPVDHLRGIGSGWRRPPR